LAAPLGIEHQSADRLIAGWEGFPRGKHFQSSKACGTE
jgi:hypothetical protein